MAQRKALVLVNNVVQEISSSDDLVGASSAHSFTATNNNAGSMVIGNVVYIDGAGTCDLAQANADGTCGVVGVVKDTTVSAAASANLQTEGVLTATTVQWDAVAGTTGGLAAGVVYILDPDNAGQIVPITDTIDAGQWVVRVGRALSTTELLIDIDDNPVKRN